MRKTIGALLAAALLSIGFAQPAEAAPKPPKPKQVFCVALTGTVMIGDSMTVGATPYLKQRQPTWYIDGRWGRGVTELPTRYDLWKSTHMLPPKMLIIALGTNEQAGWTLESYRQVVRRLSPHTRLVFVNTWRPLALTAGGSTGAEYSAWMRQIARERPGTTIANWRKIAKADPTLIRDGIHQSEGRGIAAWGDAVLNAAAKAEKRARRLGC